MRVDLRQLILVCFFGCAVACVSPPEATRDVKRRSLVRASDAGLDVVKLQGFVNDRSVVIVSGVDIADVKRISSETVAIQLDAEEGSRLEISFGLASALTSDGYLLTAAHVVQEKVRNSDSVWLVRNAVKEPFSRARIVWVDPVADLAILKGDFETAKFEFANRLPLSGEIVFSHGKDAWPSAGRVNRVMFDGRRKTYVIEHSGPLKRGDSGGAAVNADGALLGVNTEISFAGSTAVVAPKKEMFSIIARDRRRQR
ncbi:MAG: S1-C subfamily serine protease [Verrucomicrobiales bacterium]|jgi:S1-C subfamily serine protease